MNQSHDFSGGAGKQDSRRLKPSQQLLTQQTKSRQPAPPPQVASNKLKSVLIIDGAYLQIGINQMNQQYNYFFQLDAQGNFYVLLTFLERIACRKFDQIRFVTAEDTETQHKHQKLYDEIEKAKQSRQIFVDQRDYKYRSQMCRCGCKQEIKSKVQAEVDVAIAVYLIDYALCSQVENIILFAGDRDFIDSINYVQERLHKQVLIMGFEQSTGSKIKGMNFIDVTQEILRLAKERQIMLKHQANMIRNTKNRSRSHTPEKKHIKQQEAVVAVNNPEIALKKAKENDSSIISFGITGKVSDPSKDPILRNLLKNKLPKDFTMVPGQYFADMLFPKEILQLLVKHPQLSQFDIEQAYFTVGEQAPLEEIVDFLFNTHEFLTGKLEEIDVEALLFKDCALQV